MENASPTPRDLFLMLRGKNLRTIEETIARAHDAGIHGDRISSATAAYASYTKLLTRSAGKKSDSKVVLDAMSAAEKLWMTLDHLNSLTELRTELVRDRARQEGTKKPRNAKLQSAIQRMVRNNPSATAEELYRKAPLEVTDQIGIDRFVKRVTAARKALKALVASN